jgi:hypothetical protein
MESYAFQNMDEVDKFPMESKKKVICSGRMISLSSGLNLSGGVVSMDSLDVQSCESIHSVDKENPIGGGNIRVTSDISMSRGGHYLLCPKRGSTPLVLLASKGLGSDFPKYLRPLIVGKK